MQFVQTYRNNFIIKTTVLLLLCIATTACGRAFETLEPTFVDPELAPYLEQYSSYKEQATGSSSYREVTLKFKVLGSDIIGLCTRFSTGKRIVEIDPFFWDAAGEDRRDILILHEMGHCDLNREHVSNSIMQPSLLTVREYLGRMGFYLTELFTNFSSLPQVEYKIVQPCTHDSIWRH